MLETLCDVLDACRGELNQSLRLVQAHIEQGLALSETEPEQICSDLSGQFSDIAAETRRRSDKESRALFSREGVVLSPRFAGEIF